MNFDSKICKQLSAASLDVYVSRYGDIYEPTLDLSARIIKLSSKTILVFRGTISLRNWLVDLYAFPNALGIHTGFYNAWMLLRRRVLAELPHDKPIYVTGHSLGGALAVLAAQYVSPEAIYTFGQPRVAHPDALLSNAPHFRIVDKEDIVPHVPGLLAGYRHRGELVFFPDIGPVEYNPPEWRQLASHVLGIAADLYRFHSGEIPEWVIVREHSMSLYNQLVSAL